MNEAFKIIGDLGFPIAAALAGGYFVYLTIKLLLAGVLSSIKGMAGIITALDNRVKTMNHDVIRIDTIVSNALGLKPDVERIARADGKTTLGEIDEYSTALELHSKQQRNYRATHGSARRRSTNKKTYKISRS
jgi:hypothetical protein